MSAAAVKWMDKQDKARGRRGHLQRSRAWAMKEDAALHAVRDDDRMLRRGSVRQLVGTMSFADSVFPRLMGPHPLAPTCGTAADDNLDNSMFNCANGQ